MHALWKWMVDVWVSMWTTCPGMTALSTAGWLHFICSDLLARIEDGSHLPLWRFRISQQWGILQEQLSGTWQFKMEWIACIFSLCCNGREVMMIDYSSKAFGSSPKPFGVCITLVQSVKIFIPHGFANSTTNGNQLLSTENRQMLFPNL